MTIVHLDQAAYQFPDNWGDIPPVFRAGVLRIVWEQGQRTPLGRLAILYALNPIPARQFKKLTAWQVNELCILLDWVWQMPVDGCPFENFEHGGITYYLPGENFKNTSFAEFLNAYAYFFQLMYDEDLADRDEIASKLIATLCRPAPIDLDILAPTWSGDLREAFNEHVVEPRSTVLLDVNTGILAGIIQYFLHELRWLHETYEIFEAPVKQVMDPDEDEDPALSPAAAAAVEGYDWISALMDMKDIKYILVEEKLYLSPQAVMADNLNNVFDAMIRLKERESKQEPVPQHQTEYQD